MSHAGAAHGPDGDPIIEQTGFRLSWGAIVAGMFVATALHIVLALVGVAIGLDNWNTGDRVDTLGMGLGIWTLVAGIIALFIGGTVTGRLAGILTRGDGMLHGVVLWSLSTLLAAWLVAGGMGTIVGSAFGLVSRATTTAISTVGQLGVAAVGQAGTLDLGAIQRELEAALEESGVPALQPDSLAQAAQQAGQQATGPVSNEAVIQDVLAEIQRRGGQVDREAITNVIVARTGMSQQEAARVADRVESAAQSVGSQVGMAVDTVGAYAEDAVDRGSELVSTAAWWSLLALGLSLVASVTGVAVRARS